MAIMLAMLKADPNPPNHTNSDGTELAYSSIKMPDLAEYLYTIKKVKQYGMKKMSHIAMSKIRIVESIITGIFLLNRFKSNERTKKRNTNRIDMNSPIIYSLKKLNFTERTSRDGVLIESQKNTYLSQSLILRPGNQKN
jgi:hypothetical protein